MSKKGKMKVLSTDIVEKAQKLSEMGMNVTGIAKFLNLGNTTVSQLKKFSFDLDAYHKFNRERLQESYARTGKLNRLTTASTANNGKTEEVYTYSPQIGALLAEINKSVSEIKDILVRKETKEKLSKSRFFNFRD